MTRGKPLHVVMLGLRGFPNVQGGIETHCEHLCPLLVSEACKVTVIVRVHSQPRAYWREWAGVRFVPIWAPRTKGLESLLHSIFGVLYAAVVRPDIVHIHAVGPALVTPLARLLGLKVVVTHHGPDYERQKWGAIGKLTLQAGERWGMRLASGRIAISRGIHALILQKYGAESAVIPNGVSLPEPTLATETLSRFGLEPMRYVLLVSRLVPEKRHLDLITAFEQAAPAGWKLVLVGKSDNPDQYSRDVLERAAASPNVLATGFLSGSPLREIFQNAGLFVLPSSHEGLPIALLEALSFGLPVLASDIPANLEVGLPEDDYFPLGDVGELARKLAAKCQTTPQDSDKQKTKDWVLAKYDWTCVAKATLDLYRAIKSGSNGN